VGANKEETVVNCAFQWAQRPDYIYLNIKYSSRIDGPVTVLNVDNEKVRRPHLLPPPSPQPSPPPPATATALIPGSALQVTFTNESFSFEGVGPPAG
jgi:hypothetical protein